MRIQWTMVGLLLALASCGGGSGGSHQDAADLVGAGEMAGQDLVELVADVPGEITPEDLGCVPQCGNRVCGDDGCNGSCGECVAGYDCGQGQCIANCGELCEVRECGPAGLAGECACGECSDGVDCTVDVCTGAGQCNYVDLQYLCDDGKVCTADSCSLQTGCVNTLLEDGTPCNDMSPCTVEDSCSGGMCKGTMSLCPDGSLCNPGTPCPVGYLQTAGTFLLAGGATSDHHFTADGTLADGPAYGGLTVCKAVSKAPEWLRPRLTMNLLSMSPETRTSAMELLGSVTDPLHVDEVSFQLAALPAEELEADGFDFQLLVDNVQCLYGAVPLLGYAELIEVGDSASSDGYYTTVQYQLADGQLYELPRNLYYWYVVHPRLDTEAVAYIDPMTGEAAPSPNGRFWRCHLLGENTWERHPLFEAPQEIAETDLDGWHHGLFDQLEFGVLELVVGENGGLTTFELRLGEGNIIATMMPVEKAWDAGQSVFLENLLRFGKGAVQPTDSLCLVLRERPLFGSAAIEDILDKSGMAYDVAAGTELTAELLSNYDRLVVPSDQPLEFYEALADSGTTIEEWVLDGGIFEFHGAVEAEEDDWAGLVMPGGFSSLPQGEHYVNDVRMGGYPSLLNSVSSAPIAWDGQSQAGSPGERPLDSTAGAVEAVSWWTGQVMPDSVAEWAVAHPEAGVPERPSQPVRIVQNHFGNVGEMQDLLAAAGRTALLPVVNVLNVNEDQMWNEFHLADEWHTWSVEPSDGPAWVDDDGFTGSVKGGGDTPLSIVVRHRGDGFQAALTADYENVWQFYLSVVDSQNGPVPGAEVLLASETAWQSPDGSYPLAVGTQGFTDMDGLLSMPFGVSNNYYAKVLSPLGELPPGGAVVHLADVGEYPEGGEGSMTMAFTQPLPAWNVTEVPPESGDEPAATLDISIQPPQAWMSGSSVLSGQSYLEEVGALPFDLYILNGDNLALCLDGAPCQAAAKRSKMGKLDETFSLPAGVDYHVVLALSKRPFYQALFHVEMLLQLPAER